MAASQPWIAKARPIWIADADRGDRKRFVVQADRKLTGFVELEAQLGASQRLGCSVARDASSMKKAPQTREPYQPTLRSKK
jgi:hypothetical protein